MRFHVASKGVAINFGFLAGWSCFNCPYKIIKKFPRSLGFYKLNSYQALSYQHINYIFKHYFDQCRVRRIIGIFKFILMNGFNA